MPKKPIHKENPPLGKYPRGGEKAEKIAGPVAWHIRTIDQEGPWGWRKIDASTLWEEVFSKISNFETMEWSEILNRNNHAVQVAGLCSQAQKRLSDIKQDDTDEMVSLHLTGKKRIWGIKDRNILKIIWWDPEHSVCPSLKKHT